MLLYDIVVFIVVPQFQRTTKLHQTLCVGVLQCPAILLIPHTFTTSKSPILQLLHNLLWLFLLLNAYSLLSFPNLPAVRLEVVN